MIALDVIQKHAAQTPDRPALIAVNRYVSWLGFADEVARSAGALAMLFDELGPTHPRRIAFLGDSDLDIVVLQAAAATLGIAIVGIDHSLEPAAVAACLDQLKPAVFVVSPWRRQLARTALARATAQPAVLLHLGASGSSGRSWPKLTASGSWPPPDGWKQGPFEAFGFTSGTSGTPKLVVRTESFAARRRAAIVEMFGIAGDDVYLNTVPLFHASASGWARIFLSEGAPVVIAGDEDSACIARLAREHGVTFTLMVPPVLAEFTEQARVDDARPPLRAIVTGGRHVSPQLVRDVDATFGRVLHVYYGTTETGLNTLATPADLADDPTTAGGAFPGNAIAIVDRHGGRVRPGEPGFVAISGYMLASHFGDGSAPVIDLDGVQHWVTADTGCLDSDGRLRIFGRELGDQLHDVIGAEAAVRTLDGVADVAIVLAAPDREAVVAYVPKLPPSADLTAEVHATASAALGGLDVRCLKFDAIPYSPSGKVRPAALLARA